MTTEQPNQTERTAIGIGTDAPAKVQPQPTVPVERPVRDGDERMVEAILARVRGVDLETISKEDAVELAAEVSLKLRTLRRGSLCPEDMDLLARLMSRLLATGR